MLTLVGTGLCDSRDLTARGKEAIACADAVYLEGYTSLLGCTLEEFSQDIGRPITLLLREDVEVRLDAILAQAQTGDVAILVIGDVFGATTHTDLYLRAKALGINVQIVHNAGIMSAIGVVGLQRYRFGKTVSIPYWLPGFEPKSFVAGIMENKQRGLHTLCLLDIKADEQRFMGVSEAITHLERAGFEDLETVGVGVARIGWPDEQIVAAPLRELAKIDFGRAPHALIIPGTLHDIEEEMLQLWVPEKI